MKKFLVILVVSVAALCLMISVGCKKASPSGPDTGATETAVANTSVNATATAVAVANANATATAVAVANAADTAKYNFDSNAADQTGDWTVGLAMSAKTWNKVIDAGHLGSTGCLQVTLAGTGTQTNSKGFIQYAYPWDNALNGGLGDHSVADFTGKTVQIWVNVPASMVNNFAVNFDIQSYTNAGGYKDCTHWVTLTTAGWSLVAFDMSITGDYVQPGWDITKITQVQAQVMKTADASPDYSGTILFDSINW
jgi:hypothetical protein